MALSTEDKAEIVQIIRAELDRLADRIAKGSGGLDVRTVGRPLDDRETLRRPMASDQCCNGCD